MSDTSGRTSPPPFAFYDPESSCWRTSAATLDGDSTLSSVTLPASGSMLSGELFARPTSALPIVASGSSSSRLLPSPAASNPNDGEALDSWEARRQRNLAKGINGNGQGTPLSVAVRLLPTPRTTDTNGAGSHGDGGPDLRTVVSLLPTPNASLVSNRTDTQLSGDGRDKPNKLGWAVALLPTPTATNRHGNHENNRGELLLPGVVASLLPTPRASDTGTPGRRASEGFRPPLSQVLLSNGVTTPPPSDDGSTSPDDQRPGQLSLGEPASD